MVKDTSLALSLMGKDKDSLLFTGVKLMHFNALVSVLSEFQIPAFRLSVVDQIFMTLMKLKLNPAYEDIAHRFQVSQSMASKVISHWIDVMGELFKDLIVWPDREGIQLTMPLAFKKHYPNTTCIIDCAETFIQKARNLDSRGATYSHYKGTNTAKYLVAVAPSGLIMFISDVFVGRSSDKYITVNSGFLDCLRPGDEVMADRGFRIHQLLAVRKVKLNIPAFTLKRSQLTYDEVTRTRRIANVRIHVERAIRRIKVFRIVSQTFPINMLGKFSKILKICAGLCNLKRNFVGACLFCSAQESPQ